MPIDPEELEPLVALLDDRDSVVTELVDGRLASFGPEVVRSLRNRAERESDPALRALITERGRKLNTEFRLADLQDFTSRPTGPLSLFEGSWIISSLLDWTLTRDRYEELFFRCSQEYLAEGSDSRTGVENIRILNHIFYHRLGFTLYDVQLRKTEHSLVSEALRTRQGNPFVLALIYLMICQVSGLPVELLCFTGGFVPAYVEGGRVLFYINVYRGGDIFPKERFDMLLKATGLQVDKKSIRRRDESAMLTLYLESLLYIHSQGSNDPLCTTLERALTTLGPDRYLTIDEQE